MIGELERMLRIAGGWLISRILRLDLMLLAIVMCLVTVGFITLFSAGYSFPWRIEDQVRNLIVAAGAMFATALVPVRWIRRISVPCFVIGCLLCSPRRSSASPSRERRAGSTWACASSPRRS